MMTKKEASDNMTKDIHTILDRWLATWEAVYKSHTIKRIRDSDQKQDESKLYELYADHAFIYSFINRSFNDILLDSNIFEVLFPWQVAMFAKWYGIEEEPQMGLRLEAYTDNWWYYDIWWKYHKAICLLLPTQKERVNYILENLTEKQ